MEKAIKDYYLEKEFVYHTKYGGVVKGVVKGLSLTISSTIVDGEVYRKPSYVVLSENSVPYPIKDIYVKD